MKILFLGFLSLIILNQADDRVRYLQQGQNILRMNSEWYKSDAAIQIANNIILFQRNDGGWSKNKDLTSIQGNTALERVSRKDYLIEYSTQERDMISNDKRRTDSTFDNGKTWTELRYLAKVYSATNREEYKLSFNRGLDLVLETQYENGGWPQLPDFENRWSWDMSRWNPDGLERLITFNDNVVVSLIELLKDIRDGLGDFQFVDNERKLLASDAVDKGISMILASQVYQNSRKTAWAAQIDERTFEPRWGRNFEPPSIDSGESVAVIELLMSLENPNEAVIEAIQLAVKWLDEVKILNTRVVRGTEPFEALGRANRLDAFIIEDSEAPPIWARMYELNTYKPVFASRNDTIYYNLADISMERRSGYGWYGYGPSDLLNQKYPEWCKNNNIKNILLSE